MHLELQDFWYLATFDLSAIGQKLPGIKCLINESLTLENIVFTNCAMWLKVTYEQLFFFITFFFLVDRFGLLGSNYFLSFFALRLPKKQLMADWSTKRVGCTPCLLHTHTHTHTMHTQPCMHTNTHTLLASPLWLLHRNFKGIIGEWARITVGRPLQQSRNAPLHYQDYLPVKARRTQLSFSELIFALVSSWGMRDTEWRKKTLFFERRQGSSWPGAFPSSFSFISLSLAVSFSRGFFRSALLNWKTQNSLVRLWNLKRHFCCLGEN